jgi:GxxExxY protein
MATTDFAFKELTYRIIGSAMEVHRCLGPGLLEKTYLTCLHHQLQVDGLRATSEVAIPVHYKDLRLDASYRADLVIEETALVELKAVEQIMPIHCMQTLTYLKLSRLPIGLLINFNVPSLQAGIRRFAYTSPAS